MTITRNSLAGIYAGLPTPWDAAGRLDLDAFGANVEKVIGLGADGVYCSDTTGEFYAVTDDEFRRLVDALAEGARGRPVGTMAGCTATDTAGIVRRMEYAATQGIGAVHVAIPFWTPPSDAEIEALFADLARACPGMPIVHYNSGYARRTLTGAHYRRLAETFPALVGTKIVSSDLYVWTEIVESAPDLAHFCGDFYFLTGLMHGARGMYSSLIYVLPGVMRRIYDLARAGEWAAALPLDRALGAFAIEALEPLLAGGYADGAIDKAMAVAAGFLNGTRSMRPPYHALSEEHAEHLRRVLDTHRPLFADLLERSA